MTLRALMSCLLMLLLGTQWLFSSAVVQAQEEQPQVRVTGTGGRFLHYSSKQSTVELTPVQQAALTGSRDGRYANVNIDTVLEAVSTVLRQPGYSAIDVDRQFHWVEAEHDELLVSKGRRTLRGLLKSKAPMPAKPDHQTIFATVMLMPVDDGCAVAVRSRFKSTIWDSNGDAQTQLLSDPQLHQVFYASVARQLVR